MEQDMAHRLRTLGRLIVSRRQELGLATTVALAGVTKMTTRTLYDLEAGKRRAGRNTYSTIERVLGWPTGSIDDFLNDVGDDPLRALAAAPPPASARTSGSGHFLRAVAGDPDPEYVALSDPDATVRPASTSSAVQEAALELVIRQQRELMDRFEAMDRRLRRLEGDQHADDATPPATRTEQGP